MVITKKTISLALSLVSILGVGMTSILSIKGHEKASAETDEKAKIKHYIPPIVSGVVTSACILGAYGASASEIATLTAACSCLTANKSKIEQVISDKLGPEELKDIKKQALPVVPVQRTVEDTGYGSLLCFEEYSARFFYSSMEAVEDAEKKLSSRYRNGHRISLNDFYDYLGIQRTTFGNNWGWVPDPSTFNPRYYDDNPLCFDDQIVEDSITKKAVRLITFYNFPTSNWMYDE